MENEVNEVEKMKKRQFTVLLHTQKNQNMGSNLMYPY